MDAPPPAQPGADATAHHRRHLARGFNWLGGATLVAKITDFSTIIVVLLYLTQQQVGIGSLVISFGMMIEAFDGLGTGDAIVQAQELSHRHLQSLFWYILGIAVIVSGLTLAAAPLVQMFYNVPGMAAYFIVIALKQPIVGGAVIPMALLNRELRYERIAAINVASTFGAALTRLVIALLGGGAWALVGSFLASGVFILAGSLWARPFRPSLRFSLAEIRPLAHFGLRSATAHISDQIFKNIDYLLVGWFYGPTPLALYRVVFDLAMEPAMAVGTLVNRTALPVFARVAAVPAHLREALLWSLQRLTTLVAPFMAALMLVALPLTSLLHDSQGHSYAAGALPLQILAAAAILRVTSQLLPPVLLASGKPGTAASLSTITLTMLTLGILAVGFSCHTQIGLIAVASIWFAVYPPLLAWGAHYLWRHWQITLAQLLRPFLPPAIGIAAMVAMASALRLLPWGDAPVFRIASVVMATGLTYAGLLLRNRHPPALAKAAASLAGTWSALRRGVKSGPR
ncbi:oligosaccharide flippase family protein [Acidocella sp. KAb 2-4]|uniref:oligosaccharide flippase family protein n=1 Tax=Acidocella sp. KAb 2-4 TaxID=2885158 RepID=UPI001D08D44F|nr:oligosaccharide flippase family protein [Acidocella sp. KAb 2-4]MCB5943890.1 oligosaccharide flippase family protein [Acidocella sp. KAb 2-4]